MSLIVIRAPMHDTIEELLAWAEREAAGRRVVRVLGWKGPDQSVRGEVVLEETHAEEIRP